MKYGSEFRPMIMDLRVIDSISITMRWLATNVQRRILYITMSRSVRWSLFTILEWHFQDRLSICLLCFTCQPQTGRMFVRESPPQMTTYSSLWLLYFCTNWLTLDARSSLCNILLVHPCIGRTVVLIWSTIRFISWAHLAWRLRLNPYVEPEYSCAAPPSLKNLVSFMGATKEEILSSRDHWNSHLWSMDVWGLLRSHWEFQACQHQASLLDLLLKVSLLNSTCFHLDLPQVGSWDLCWEFSQKFSPLSDLRMVFFQRASDRLYNLVPKDLMQVLILFLQASQEKRIVVFPRKYLSYHLQVTSESLHSLLFSHCYLSYLLHLAFPLLVFLFLQIAQVHFRCVESHRLEDQR